MRRPRDKGRCTGDCCRQFTLPLSPEQLRKGYELWLARGSGHLMEMSATDGAKYGPIYSDIHLIYPMVVYIGFRVPPAGTNPTDYELRLGKRESEHFYSCKHLGETGDCTIYEHRPRMCRRFPYGHRCQYQGCTWGEQRAVRETKAQTEKRWQALKGLRLDKEIKKP